MKTIKILLLVFAVAFMAGCNNEPTLQEYYVENQEDHKFVAIDFPTSLFANKENLDVEQRETLETVKKINFLAFPVKEGKEEYENEKNQLSEILKNEKYQLLMKYGSNDRKAEVYFTGEEDAIDELIVYGFDDSQGMGVARVLGEDMNPENLLKFFRSLEKGDIDLNGLKGFAGMFTEGEEREEEKAIPTDTNRKSP